MKARILTSVVLVCFVQVSLAVGAVLNVPVDHATIQSAIDDAANGDTVQVAAGTYTENLVWNTKSLNLIGAGADVTTVNGGGAGSCLVMTNVPDTARVEGFTFTGGSAVRGGGFYLDNSSAMLTNNTITNNVATGIGLSDGGGGLFLYNSSPALTNNTISGNSGTAGGGLNLQQQSHPTLNNNTIMDNLAVTLGGGLVLYSSSPTLTGNTITGNSTGGNGGAIMAYPPSSPTLVNNIIANNSATGAGGGLRVGENATLIGNTITGNSAGTSGGGFGVSENATVTNNTITGNSSRDAGGGVYCENGYVGTMADNIITGNSTLKGGGGVAISSFGSPTLTGNTISGNTAGYGGGLLVWYSSPTLVNNLIINNTATGYNFDQQFGGGLCVINDSSPILTNNTIAYNSGGGLQNYGHPAGTPVITNCILWGNSDYDLGGAPSTVTYSDIGVGFVSGGGNISADPLFIDSTSGDYHLWSISPCIDTGYNLAPSLPETDKDGNPRIYGEVVDMGAYESSAIEVAIDIKPGSEDGDDNTISLGTQGLIPVAIFSTEDFDATDVAPETVVLAGAEVQILGKSNEFMAQEVDVDEDGLMDLVVHVATANFDPEVVQEGKVVLTGSTNDGQAFAGWDDVTIVPAE